MGWLLWSPSSNVDNFKLVTEIYNAISVSAKDLLPKPEKKDREERKDGMIKVDRPILIKIR